MAECTTNIDSFQAEKSTIDVSEKYLQLMQDSLSEESIYMRAKDTILTIFSDLGITEIEKANIVASNITQMSTTLSAQAMSSALAWAKEERDGAYALAKLKADTEVAQGQLELTKSQICKTDFESLAAKAKATEITASSIRENGTVLEYEADGIRAKSLNDGGLKYEQTKQVEGATYQIFADAYRKSGVVSIGLDVSDGLTKGISGDDDGYTNQQSKNAERLRVAYEDSKLNHAANSSASMIGQMLSAEIAPDQADVQLWRDAVSGLLTKHSSTSQL